MGLASPAARPGGRDASRAHCSLERAADLTVRAPAGRGPRPWRLEVLGDRLLLRAERPSRPQAHGAGAALFTTRVVLAAEGWAAAVERLPDPDDPDPLAVVRPLPFPPDAALAALAPAVLVGDADPPALTGDRIPVEVLHELARGAATEGVQLVPVLREPQRRLVTRLVGQAADATPVLLVTPSDTAPDWLRCGEALQRVLLELTRCGSAARAFPEVVAVPLTRTQLRSALAWNAHPQLLLRIGRPVVAPGGVR